MNPTSESPKPTIPSSQEIALAEKSRRVLTSTLKENESLTFRLVQSGKESENLKLPKSALKLLIAILSQMAKGNAVTLIPIHAELTTQEAADLLNVSRPFLVSLLSDGKIPFRKVGTRRRVLAKDILNYKENIDKNRLKTLEKLAEQDQDLDMGY